MVSIWLTEHASWSTEESSSANIQIGLQIKPAEQADPTARAWCGQAQKREEIRYPARWDFSLAQDPAVTSLLAISA